MDLILYDVPHFIFGTSLVPNFNCTHIDMFSVSTFHNYKRPFKLFLHL